MAAVIGLGKIGLPLAVQIASKGVAVVGGDRDPARVEAVNRGESPFPREEGLAEALASVVESGRLRATTDNREAAAEADTVLVVVPLVLDGGGTPDFDALDAATREVGSVLRPGRPVIYETTLPVGTTRGRLGRLLVEAGGPVPGEGLLLAYSPERVYSGRMLRDLRRYPKLVGGIDEPSGTAAVRFYEKVLDFDQRDDLGRPNGVWDLGSAESAELVKLAETTYRDVNIALANELARFAEEAGVDVDEVIEAANSQPFSHLHRPGVAVGGHCIPVYPRFYLEGDPAARLPRVAREVNERVPVRVVDRLVTELNGLDGRRVAILGAAYRGGVKETAFSGAFPLAAEISRRGGRPMVHDPLFDEGELQELGLTPFRLGERCEAAVLQADHEEYRDLRPDDLPGCTVMYDGRGVLDSSRWEAAGVRFLRIGRG